MAIALRNVLSEFGEQWWSTSVLPLEADIRRRIEHVRLVPKADIGRTRASERSVSAASTDMRHFDHIRIIVIFALRWNPGFD
jgi:hypothetical protein